MAASPLPIYLSDQADEIRKAMTGFSLPLPPWARVVPEQQWKSKLISQLPGQAVQQANPWHKSCDSQAPIKGSSPRNSEQENTTVKTNSWANFSDFKDDS